MRTHVDVGLWQDNDTLAPDGSIVESIDWVLEVPAVFSKQKYSVYDSKTVNASPHISQTTVRFASPIPINDLDVYSGLISIRKIRVNEIVYAVDDVVVEGFYILATLGGVLRV